ncbi:CRISPR-associated protein [anaerobic digester metagenome]
MIEKLREYKVAYTDLEQLTSEYLLKSENNGWDISKDEISYYFTLGLNLARIFKVKGDENE